MIIMNKLSAKEHSGVKSQSTQNYVKEQNRFTHSNWDLNHLNFIGIGGGLSRDNEARGLASMLPAQKRAISIDIQRTVGNHFFRDFGLGITPISKDFGLQGVGIQRKTINLKFPEELGRKNYALMVDKDEEQIRKLIEKYNNYPVKIFDLSRSDLISQLKILDELYSCVDQFWMPIEVGSIEKTNPMKECMIKFSEDTFNVSRSKFLKIILDEKANVEIQLKSIEISRTGIGLEEEKVPAHISAERYYGKSSAKGMSGPRQDLETYLGKKFPDLGKMIKSKKLIAAVVSDFGDTIYGELVHKSIVHKSKMKSECMDGFGFIKPIFGMQFSAVTNGNSKCLIIGISSKINYRSLAKDIENFEFVDYSLSMSSCSCMDRVYINIRQEKVAAFIEWAVNNILMAPGCSDKIHHFKIAVKPDPRADRVVIYTNDERTSMEIGKRISECPTLKGWFNELTPIMTEKLGPGISRGAEPMCPGQSFSTLRAALISNVMANIIVKGKVIDLKGFKERVLGEFKKNNIDPDDPSRNYTK